MSDTCEKHCEATAFKITIRGLEHEVVKLKAERKPLNWEPIQEFWRNNSNIDWDELESAIKQAAHDMEKKHDATTE